MLNEKIKKELLKKVNSIQIEPETLSTYRWIKNPYEVEEQLIGSSGEGDWDVNEEWKAQVEDMVKSLGKDGLYQYTDLSNEEQELDEKTGELTHQAINWLNSLI